LETNMLSVYRVLAAVSLAASLIWLASSPESLDRWIVTLSAAAILASAFVGPLARKLTKGMSQEVAANSIAVQAGRDAKVSVDRKSESSDV
jgi:hypothetical protein